MATRKSVNDVDTPKDRLVLMNDLQKLQNNLDDDLIFLTSSKPFVVGINILLAKLGAVI